jgi:hypothetical protein
MRLAGVTVPARGVVWFCLQRGTSFSNGKANPSLCRMRWTRNSMSPYRTRPLLQCLSTAPALACPHPASSLSSHVPLPHPPSTPCRRCTRAAARHEGGVQLCKHTAAKCAGDAQVLPRTYRARVAAAPPARGACTSTRPRSPGIPAHPQLRPPTKRARPVHRVCTCSLSCPRGRAASDCGEAWRGVECNVCARQSLLVCSGASALSPTRSIKLARCCRSITPRCATRLLASRRRALRGVSSSCRGRAVGSEACSGSRKWPDWVRQLQVELESERAHHMSKARPP